MQWREGHYTTSQQYHDVHINYVWHCDSIEMCVATLPTYLEVVALKEVGSRRNWMVSLLLAAPLCAPALLVAPTVQSILHTAGRRGFDDQEQTHLPDTLWSERIIIVIVKTRNFYKCKSGPPTLSQNPHWICTIMNTDLFSDYKIDSLQEGM